MSRHTVWKYTFVAFDALVPKPVTMPAGAVVRHVEGEVTGGEVVVSFWATVDPSAERETRLFTVRGTGDEVEPDAVYRGTATPRPGIVLHLFEIPSHL
jgi:hypothetical protein